ncbi:MAG: hypothetical protein MUC96_27815 [Myxococcaceae bacterium]|jgi:hypothetical protein|nr:hypothetical protein [Myxococcaceae bacterium]
MRPLIAALVVVSSACGLVPGRSARCDLRPQTPQCTDWRNNLQPVFATQQALCMTLGATSAGGVFSEGQTCPTEEMWGGCQTRAADGSLQTNWYYKSEKYKTREAAQAECASAMTFVDPS